MEMEPITYKEKGTTSEFNIVLEERKEEGEVLSDFDDDIIIGIEDISLLDERLLDNHYLKFKDAKPIKFDIKKPVFVPSPPVKRDPSKKLFCNFLANFLKCCDLLVL